MRRFAARPVVPSTYELREWTMDDFDPRSRMINIPGRARGQHGGAYLPTRQRMLWFRQVHPSGSIETEMIELSETRAVFKATVTFAVYTPTENPERPAWVDWVKCVGHGSETKGDFPDYIEKAETKAIGRALAAAGFGTEAAFEENPDRPADAPVTAKGDGSTQNQLDAVATQNQVKQINDLVVALKIENIGVHLKSEYGVDETPLLTFEQARELIARLRVRLEKVPGAVTNGV
jgi:hypothetical protein